MQEQSESDCSTICLLSTEWAIGRKRHFALFLVYSKKEGLRQGMPYCI